MRKLPRNTNNGVTIDLPLPPSVNRTVAHVGNGSPQVRRWRQSADAMVLVDRRRIYAGALRVPFELHVLWPAERFGQFDIDNRVKPLLDWLERVELIRNDKDCVALTVGWGEAPMGCRVRLVAA